MKEILIETEKLAHWDDISQMELDSNQAVSPDMDLMMQNLFHRIAASSPESIESVVARTYRGTPEDDDVRSALAHEIAKNIIEARSSTPLLSEVGDVFFFPCETQQICYLICICLYIQYIIYHRSISICDMPRKLRENLRFGIA